LYTLVLSFMFVRFAYSLVDDEETDDHIEQGRNKNFGQ